MSFGQESIDIESYFKPRWTATTVEYDNMFLDKKALTEWTRFRVMSASARQASLGNNPLFRYRGIVVIQHFIRVGLGAGRARALADLSSTIFLNLDLGNIHFGVPEASSMGSTDGWYGWNVDCPFYREEYAS